MMHRLTSALFIFVLLLMQVPARSQSFRLEGTLGQPASAGKAFLYYSDLADGSNKSDSVQLEKGRFVLTGTVPVPTKAYLYVVDATKQYHSLEMYLEPGRIQLTSSDSLENAVVRGGPLNADFNQLQTKLKPMTAAYAKLVQAYKTARAALPDKRPTLAFAEAWDKQFETIEAQKKPVYAQFIRQMPNSVVSIEAIKSYGGYVPDVTVVKPLFNGLSAAVRNSPAGQAYARDLANLERVAVGAMAPEFTQADTLGKAISLHDFKGKYVLIDFWASWCGPCRLENPNLVKNFNQYKSRNFTILGVSLDKDKEAWLKAIRKDGLTWTQVSDLKSFNNAVARLYSVQSIPQNVLIGPDGRLLAKDLNGDALGKKLAELLPPTP